MDMGIDVWFIGGIVFGVLVFIALKLCEIAIRLGGIDETIFAKMTRESEFRIELAALIVRLMQEQTDVIKTMVDELVRIGEGIDQIETKLSSME